MNTLRDFFARFRFSRRESVALIAVFGLYVVGLTWRHVQRSSMPFDQDFYAAIDAATADGALTPGAYATQVDTIPKPEDKETADSVATVEEAAESSLQMDTGRLNVNLATERQLTLLPGIGPALARRIIEYRGAAGSFRTIDELLNVRGIGPKKLAKFEGMIVTE